MCGGGGGGLPLCPSLLAPQRGQLHSRGMLFADKQALETELKVSLLEIRERELNLYASNCRNIASITCMLAGFAYVTLTFEQGNSETFEGASARGKWLYELVAYSSLILNSVSMFGSTVCSMLGPGLALRGQDGAMDQAVEGLALEYRTIFMLFLTGILSFYLCFSIFLMLDTTSDWLDWMLHVALILGFLFFLRSTLVACKRIYKKFRLPPQHAIAGSFDPDNLVPHRSRAAQRLEHLQRNRSHWNWLRRQYLYAIVFMNEFVGISPELFEERYQVHLKNSSRSRRPNNSTLHRIIRYLERPDAVTSTASRNAAASGMAAASDLGMTASSSSSSRDASGVRRQRSRGWRPFGRQGSREETMSLPGSVCNELELSAMSPADYHISGSISPDESVDSKASG